MAVTAEVFSIFKSQGFDQLISFNLEILLLQTSVEICLLERNPMFRTVSYLKAEGLSPSNCDSNPEEKEISDDGDDDDNHKHRGRETQFLFMERDPLDQVLIRPNRKRNISFENGHTYSENNSQSSETWKR